MDWQKSTSQKDIIYYSKYREFSGIFTINDHISDNSVQINIKFIFTVYEYIIVYEYILLSKFIYIYIYIIYIYIFIFIIYIYTYIYMYIYIYIYIYKPINLNFELFVYSNIVATHTHAGYTGFAIT